MNEPRENPVAIVCKTLVSNEMQERFMKVLPEGVSVDRFTRVTMTAIQQNPAILECDRQSLYNACSNAAARGLMPDGKEGALVSFNTKVGDAWVRKAQFMPMPEGIIKEMAKAGFKCYAVSVYQNELDSMEIWNDEQGQHFKHKPILFGERGERVGSVAIATDASGRAYVEAMNMAELERVKKQSKAPDGPWKSWPERMEQKSALHRLRKRVPIIGHDDIVEAMQQDEVQDVGIDEDQPPAAPQTAPVTRTTQGRRPRGLQAVVDSAQPQEPVVLDQVEPGPDDEGIF